MRLDSNALSPAQLCFTSCASHHQGVQVSILVVLIPAHTTAGQAEQGAAGCSAAVRQRCGPPTAALAGAVGQHARHLGATCSSTSPACRAYSRLLSDPDSSRTGLIAASRALQQLGSADRHSSTNKHLPAPQDGGHVQEALARALRVRLQHNKARVCWCSGQGMRRTWVELAPSAQAPTTTLLPAPCRSLQRSRHPAPRHKLLIALSAQRFDSQHQPARQPGLPAAGRRPPMHP